MSERALSFGRTSGMALDFMAQREPEPPPPSSLPMAEAQPELFRLFAQLFAALTGRAVALVANEQEIKERMLWRLKHEPDAMAEAANAASDELAAFYSANAVKLFQHAKSLGGMRLVTGGQRAFGSVGAQCRPRYGSLRGHATAPRSGVPLSFGRPAPERHALSSSQTTLFHVLQLRPLVDAGLPVPPVFVFPSFEEGLEEHDAHTKHGMEQLAVRMVSPPLRWHCCVGGRIVRVREQAW
jgi:hypothetical protein